MVAVGKESGLPQKLTPEEEQWFPGLVKAGYRVASANAPYNCVAYAAGDTSRSWNSEMLPAPGYYWPAGAIRSREIDSLKSAFEKLGYEICTSDDLEAGYEKVA